MTNGSPAPNQTRGVAKSSTSSISWTDITPDPTSKKDWVALAINSDSSLMATSDGEIFYTSVGQGNGWSQQGFGTTSVAISTHAALGPGPGIYFPGIRSDLQPIIAASAQYQANGRYSATPQVPSPPLSDLIMQTAATYQIDADTLARQLYQESLFCPNMIEIPGAGVPHQLGQGIAMWTKPYPSMYANAIRPFDPSNAIDYAGRYTNYNRSQLRGNLGLALGAYNAGLSTILGWIAAGTPQYKPPPVNYPPIITVNYIKDITGRTMWEWAANGIKLIAANKSTSNIAVTNNSGANWVDQLPNPGALPKASVAIAGNGVDAVAGAASTLWTARAL